MEHWTRPGPSYVWLRRAVQAPVSCSPFRRDPFSGHSVAQYQCSASVTRMLELLTDAPAATQFVDKHDTPDNELSIAPAGAGGSFADHEAPVSFSAKGTHLLELLKNCPTALHIVDDAHETPSREPLVAPAGLGSSCADHAVPFQVSASGTVPLASLQESPTAVHRLAETQETPFNFPSKAPFGSTASCADQEVPFHLVANGE